MLIIWGLGNRRPNCCGVLKTTLQRFFDTSLFQLNYPFLMSLSNDRTTYAHRDGRCCPSIRCIKNLYLMLIIWGLGNRRPNCCGVLKTTLQRFFDTSLFQLNYPFLMSLSNDRTTYAHRDGRCCPSIRCIKNHH